MALHKLKFKQPEFQGQFFDKKHTDCRLRAFVREAIDTFPDHDWVITSAKRHPEHDRSGHHYKILSAFDFRCRTWSFKQLLAFWNWTYYWWQSKPDIIDVLIKDGRFDIRYKDGAPHIHIEIDKPYWK